MHIREPALDAVVVKTQPLVIEAEQVEDRRVEVVDRRDVFRGLVAELIRCAVAERALHARAGAEHVAIVRRRRVPKCTHAIPLVMPQTMPRACAVATSPVKNVSSSA